MSPNRILPAPLSRACVYGPMWGGWVLYDWLKKEEKVRARCTYGLAQFVGEHEEWTTATLQPYLRVALEDSEEGKAFQ